MPSASPKNLRLKKYLFGLQIILFFILFIPVYPDMYGIWLEHSNNSHGLLVPLISAFLLIRRRNAIRWEQMQPAFTGFIILLLSLLLYIIGFAGSIEVLPRITLVTTLIGLALYHCGWSVFSKISFPLLFLFFMVPIPVSVINFVSLPLQLMATKISAFLIQGLSIPVYREGNILYFATTSLEVAEACSGLRSLMAYLMLACLFAYMTKSAIKNRLFIVGAAIPLAFLANLLRVTGTGVLSHFFGESIARGFLHDLSGILIFTFGVCLLYLLYRTLEKRGRRC